MAGEWVKRKIGSLGRIVTGKTPPTADSSNFGGPYPFVTIPDLNGRVLIDRTERTLSEKGAELLSSCLLPPGSVMMSCIATVGKCGITVRPSFTNQQINSVIPNEDVDSRFLYYVFTKIGRELEAAGAGGSVYTNVSKTRFADIEIILPTSLSEQRAIAHILGTLDDKIELNRRMSETLEAMARALFKAWFVDFEPVRAKMEGRWKRGQSLPGLPAHLYDLFPDRLVDSELGEIPEGWEVVALPQVIDFLEGPGLRNWQYREKGIKFLNIRCIVDGDLDLVKANCISLEEFKKMYSHFALREDDIVISTSGTLGRLAIVRADHLPLMLNTSIIRMRGRNAVGLSYVWGFLQSEYFLSEMFASAAGSVQLNFGPMHLRQISVLRPPDGVLESFERVVQPLLRKSLQLRKESRTLAALRDALLPRLIRGEIRVKDAEKFLKERGL